MSNEIKAQQYNYTPLTPQKVDQLAHDIEARKIHGTWLMAPGQDPADCFLLLRALPKELLDHMKRQNIIHAYEYMDKSNGTNRMGQPTFMTASFLDKVDIARVEKRLKEIRQFIVRRTIH